MLIPRPAPVVSVAGGHVWDPGRKLKTVNFLAPRVQIHHVVDEAIALIRIEQAFEDRITFLLILGFVGRCHFYSFHHNLGLWISA